jgi:hypothetical protein
MLLLVLLLENLNDFSAVFLIFEHEQELKQGHEIA